jgi:uncharacterized protein YbcV (DUF1398 family)
MLLSKILLLFYITPMFTLDQIDNIHEESGDMETLAEYLLALKAIGVAKFDSFLTDGHSEYYTIDGEKLISEPEHEELEIADETDKDAFLEELEMHGNGETDYFEMSQGLADSGIEKWTFDTHKMTITYFDKKGTELLVEEIK